MMELQRCFATDIQTQIFNSNLILSLQKILHASFGVFRYDYRSLPLWNNKSAMGDKVKKNVDTKNW